MTSTYEDRTLLVTDVAIKSPCVTVSTTNLVLSGAQTVNGVACVAGDRVLVNAQTSSVDNGIYLCSSSGWTRSTDADGNRDLVKGTLVLITANIQFYILTTANPVLIGTSAISFSPAATGFSAINLGAGAVGSPTLTWSGDTTSGFYRPAANQIGITISGSQVANFLSTGLTVTGAATATRVVTATVDSGSTGSLSLKTNNGSTQLEIADTASVNWVRVRGSAGAEVVVDAAGGGTNVSIDLASKGTGAINFATNGNTATQFQVTHTASATRFVTVTGSNGGNPTISTTAGSLAITPTVAIGGNLTVGSGSATLTLSNGSGTPVFTVSGGNGTFVATVSSLVDLTTTGGLNLRLNPGGEISWGKALVALGGGAAPTFGTIGGTGPATAAQNSWMRVSDPTGSVFWVPAWR